MQTSQSRPILFDKTREAVSNKPRETVVAIGDATRALPDEHVLPEPGSLGGALEKVLAPPRAHRPFTLPLWPTSQRVQGSLRQLQASGWSTIAPTR